MNSNLVKAEASPPCYNCHPKRAQEQQLVQKVKIPHVVQYYRYELTQGWAWKLQKYILWLIQHFVGEYVFSVGELHKQKLFKDKIGTIFQVSDTKSSKSDTCVVV